MRLPSIILCILALAPAAHATRSFYWTMTGNTPDVYPTGGDSTANTNAGNTLPSAGIGLSSGGGLPIDGSFKLATFDKENDTTGAMEWCPISEGAIVSYFKADSVTALNSLGCMLWQITGKTFDAPSIDTNDAWKLLVRPGGTKLRLTWGGNNGATVTSLDITLTQAIQANQWYKVTARYKRAGPVTMSLAVELCDSDGVVTGSAGTTATTSSALALPACLTWHHLLLGNDVSSNMSGTGLRLDNFAVFNNWDMTGGDPDPEPENPATEITQFGVTFVIDGSLVLGTDYGQFANGDYWVKAPVTITEIRPDFAAGNNGWEVNPTVQAAQGFQSNGPYYDASLMPSLPYTASTAQSIVKVIASGVSRPTVQTAVVLTVLSTTPAGGGAGYFRPPYVGTSKPLFAVADLRTDRLPSLAPVGSPPSLASVVANFSKCLRMDHNLSHPRYFRPSNAMADYYPEAWPEVAEAMARLCLNDSVATKTPALIQFVQHCIDQAYIVQLGYRQGGDGHNPGHRLLAAWAGVMLDDLSGVLTYLQANSGFHEEEFVQWSATAGRALWGETSTDLGYWTYIAGGGGSRSQRDPYRYIDGGRLGPRGAEYQDITAQNHKSQVLVAYLIPSLQGAYQTGHWATLLDYCERWVSHGVWASPDPYAPYNGAGGGDMTGYASAYGSGVLGAGRSTAYHGTFADGGQYKSAFVAAMWAAYGPDSDVVPPSVVITTPTSSASYTASGASVVISGSAVATAGVASVTATMTGATSGSIALIGTTSWSGTATINYGATTITVTATDTLGSTATDTITIQLPARAGRVLDTDSITVR